MRNLKRKNAWNQTISKKGRSGLLASAIISLCLLGSYFLLVTWAYRSGKERYEVGSKEVVVPIPEGWSQPYEKVFLNTSPHIKVPRKVFLELPSGTVIEITVKERE